MRQFLLGTALAAVLALPVAVQAGPITVGDSGNGTASADVETQNTGFPGYVPANFASNPNSPDGYHNGSVTLAAGTYQLEYWGSGNSQADNTFTVNASANYTIVSGGPIVSIGTGGLGGYTATPLILTVTNALGAVLDFTYSTSLGCRVSSGSSNVTDCDYIAGVDGALVSGASTTGQVGYLGFADRKEGVDHDHQDLTIRITQVPEPASMLLLGAGLVGLGVARRRSSRA